MGRLEKIVQSGKQRNLETRQEGKKIDVDIICRTFWNAFWITFEVVVSAKYKLGG